MGSGEWRGCGGPRLSPPLFPGAPAGQVPAGGPGCAAAAPFPGAGAPGLGLLPLPAGVGAAHLPPPPETAGVSRTADPAAGQWASEEPGGLGRAGRGVVCVCGEASGPAAAGAGSRERAAGLASAAGAAVMLRGNPA